MLPHLIIRLGFGQFECITIACDNRLFISVFRFDALDMGLRLHFFHFTRDSSACITGNSFQRFIIDAFFCRKRFKRILRFRLDAFANIAGNIILVVLSCKCGSGLLDGLIDFLAKAGISFGYHHLWRDNGIAVFIYGNAVGINRLGGIARYIFAFLYRIELFQDFACVG